jgi:hypothetical protein
VPLKTTSSTPTQVEVEGFGTLRTMAHRHWPIERVTKLYVVVRYNDPQKGIGKFSRKNGYEVPRPEWTGWRLTDDELDRYAYGKEIE